jgi:hypothetical protein
LELKGMMPVGCGDVTPSLYVLSSYIEYLRIRTNTVTIGTNKLSGPSDVVLTRPRMMLMETTSSRRYSIPLNGRTIGRLRK